MNRTSRLSAAAGIAAALCSAFAAPAMASGSSTDHMGTTAPGPAVRSTMQLMSLAAKPAPMATNGEAARQTKGVDVANYQGNVEWSKLKADGVRFAYVKVSEGNGPSNNLASAQMSGARKAGMFVGAYHYAAPSAAKGAGAAQARAFVKAGGGWRANTNTLPGTLDLEQSVYGGGSCYGLSQAQMRTYIGDFTRTYKALTHKDAVIYANPSFWSKCTANTHVFNKTNPLWVANWGTSHPTPLGGEKRYSLWQYKGAASANTIDLDYFNGSLHRLSLFANRSW